MWGVSVPYKLCAGEKDGDENISMLIQFIKYAFKSKSLKRLTQFVESNELFDVWKVTDDMVEAKRLDRHNLVLMENLNRCLEVLRIISKVHNCIEDQRLETFDMFNEHHVLKLEMLWSSMKGGSRSQPGLISNEWTELGFQGSDPSTDFRSMGMLGLNQLLFFAGKNKETARMVLKDFSESSKPFPFAVIGINLTRLVLEMYKEYRLHKYIVERFGNLTVNCNLAYLEGPSNDQDCIDYCVSLVHEVYCIAFEEFYLIWVVRKPTSIMAFTELYNEVVALMHRKFPPII